MMLNPSPLVELARNMSHFFVKPDPCCIESIGSVATYGPGVHMLEMAKQLNDFRASGHLCDIVIKTGDGSELSAHRNILAACSPYFNALFSSGFSDSLSRVHEMLWMSQVTAENVLRFMYTGKVRIEYNELSDLLAAAEYLLLPKLKEHCVAYMKSILSISNVIWIKYLSGVYSLGELIAPVDDALFRVTGAVFLDPNLMELPLEYITALLLDQRLKYLREIDIADFVLRWVRHEVHNRQSALPILMKRVLFDCLPAWYIAQLLEDNLTKDLIDQRLKMKHNIAGEGCSTSEEDIVMLVSGNASPPCFGYVPCSDRWVNFSALPRCDVKRKSLKVVCLDRTLYLLVTMEDSMAWLSSNMANSLPVVRFWQLDIDKNMWRELARPVSSSKCFHLLRCGPHILALGITGTMEQYDKVSDEWVACLKPTRSIAYFDTIHFSDNRYLYILNIYSTSYPTGGGYSLQIYDPISDVWESLCLTCTGKDLVILSYRLPHRKSLCEKVGNIIKLKTLIGQQWGEINLEAGTLQCWDFKTIFSSKIYSDHGMTIWLPDRDAIFVLNSNSNQCAMHDCAAGYSKLTSECPGPVFQGQRTGCGAKISRLALEKMPFVDR